MNARTFCFVIPLTGILACSAPSSTSSGSGAAGIIADAASDERDASASDARTCGVDPGASPEEIAATPRKDLDAEVLALAVGSRIVAEQGTYDRIVRDLAAIRALRPELADLHVRMPFGQMFGVSFESAAAARVQGGTYDGLDCLNTQYGGNPEILESLIGVRFKGLYAIDRLACRYMTASGVARVFDANPVLGDGPKLFAWAEGDVFHFVFDRADGACPTGCTTHDAVHYETDALGGVTLVGSYSGDLQTDGPPPEWVTKRWYVLTDCLQR